MTDLPKPSAGKGRVGCPTIECEAPRTAFVEVLVGGPYQKGDRAFPYGHVALRVKTATRERVYDYGRYGATWGLGASEGEGMLRVWTDFRRYIGSENATGRVTTGYRFSLTEADADKVISFYDAKTSKMAPNQDRGHMKQYRIGDYDALERNCTTQSIDGATIALPSLRDGSDAYNQGNGLSFLEKAAPTAAGWPKRVFMPADLGNHLNALQGDRHPDMITVYQK